MRALRSPTIQTQLRYLRYEYVTRKRFLQIALVFEREHLRRLRAKKIFIKKSIKQQKQNTGNKNNTTRL